MRAADHQRVLARDGLRADGLTSAVSTSAEQQVDAASHLASASAVSTTSELVRPRWMNRASVADRLARRAQKRDHS